PQDNMSGPRARLLNLTQYQDGVGWCKSSKEPNATVKMVRGKYSDRVVRRCQRLSATRTLTAKTGAQESAAISNPCICPRSAEYGYNASGWSSSDDPRQPPPEELSAPSRTNARCPRAEDHGNANLRFPRIDKHG